MTIEKVHLLSQEDADALFIMHKEWLISFGKIGQRLVLNGTDLSGLNFSGIDLSFAIIKRCLVKNANFSNSLIDGALFELCNLSGSDFDSITLTNTVMTNCIISFSNFSNSSIRFNKFSALKAIGVTFAGTVFEKCEFVKSIMLKTIFNSSRFRSVSSSSSVFLLSDFQSTVFQDCNFSYSTFSGSDFYSAVFEKCIINDVEFLVYDSIKYIKETSILKKHGITSLSTPVSFKKTRFINTPITGLILDNKKILNDASIETKKNVLSKDKNLIITINKTLETLSVFIFSALIILYITFLASIAPESNEIILFIKNKTGLAFLKHSISFHFFLPMTIFLLSNMYTPTLLSLNFSLLRRLNSMESHASYDVKSRIFRAIYTYSMQPKSRSLIVYIIFFVPSLMMFVIWLYALHFKNLWLSLAHVVMISYTLLASSIILHQIYKSLMNFKEKTK